MESFIIVIKGLNSSATVAKRSILDVFIRVLDTPLALSFEVSFVSAFFWLLQLIETFLNLKLQQPNF